MTIQSSSQSTWADKFGAYTISTNTSGLVQQLYANANALGHRLLHHYHHYHHHYSSSWDPTTTKTTTAAAAVITVLVALATLALVAIMSWRNFWRRNDGPSSSSGPAAGPPHVSDNDFSYITHEDIAPEYRGGGGRQQYQHPQHQHQHQHQQQRRSRENTTFDNTTNEYIDSDPDILLLKHHRYKYTLAFPAYAIDDGVLRVGDLRRRAAEVTRTADPQRIKLLYKGKLLDEDALPCKAEGMKQESEVLCVVSEVHPDETSDVEDGGGGGQDDGSAVGSAVGSGVSGGSTRTGSKKKNNKKKNKKNQQQQQQSSSPPTQFQNPPSSSSSSQPQQKPPTKGISTSASSLPPPAPNLKNFATAHDQVRALSNYLYTEMLPLCDEYTANTPTEPKLRDFEHKKISETVLAQVLLKADGIEPEGNPDVRNARKQLVKDAQDILNRVDQAYKNEGV